MDSTGRYLYTTGYWLFEDGSIVRSLNVARLGTWNCVILSAFDITGYDSVVVEDGKAVITEWDSESTVLLLLDLHGEDGIEQTAGIEEEGSLASPHIEGGHLFITGTDSSGMMVYSILGDHFDKVGFFRLDRTVESIQVVDGVAYVVQGMYGLSRIPLT
ncbi:MAG: hypothetical protein GWN18_03640 [Thermoplasmata archaeon]|nr:hypothetical protein [Thermoplasmata archaeon]NIS11106.1 hypothetical protein [Thermoplasmata archaeon]NIS19051.1 hypothetical protein [Thermoplasmata archaeon]NIT76107.1 hypothetical protein [Thermoplasmata archaeon]NIU48198.1 hypothetical protein [Thermoplasmata archaeon]